MKFEISDIEIKPISFAYVVVWKKLLTNIPPLDSEFCKNLFGKPNETNFGFNQQGLTIAINNNNPIVQNDTNNNIVIISNNLPPNLVLGYEKFSIFHNNLEDFYNVYEKFIVEVKSKHSNFYSTLQARQIGINIEFELTFNDPINVKEWFSERFFSSNNKDSSFSEFNLQQFKFRISEEDRGKFVTVTLSPRPGKANLLYCLINDHYTISPTELIFDLNQLTNFVSKANSKVFDKIIPQIINQ